ncbi:MAG: putative toxin-antitoxin system toxin component, PIN family [Smithella sp.]
MLSIKRKSFWVSPSTRIKIDPEDNKFLECALEAKTRYLITGDRKHFVMAHYDKTQITSPVIFFTESSRRYLIKYL